MSESRENDTSIPTTFVPVEFDPFSEASPPESFRLSMAQKEIWAVLEMGPEASCAYNQCFVLRLQGEVSLQALKQAIQNVFQRHDALRTTFDSQGETQLCRPFEPVDIPVDDVTSTTHADQRRAQVSAVLDEEVRTPFDLVNGPVARVRIVIEATDCVLLVLTAHHIVFDGFSSALFFRELSTFYAAELTPSETQLAPATPFRFHAEAEASPAGRERATADLDYWRARFADGAPTLELPTDQPRPPIKTYNGAREIRVLTKTSGADVARVASRLGTTTVGLLLSAFQTLLYHLTGQNDVVVGLPLSARDPDPSIGLTLMGHATNLLPMRTRVDARMSFAKFAQETRAALLDAQDHGSLTFGTLVHNLNLARDMSRTPLVAAVFNFNREQGTPTFPGNQVEVQMAARRYANFEIELQLADTRRGLLLELTYNSDLFRAESVRRWLSHYEELLTGAMANPETPVGRLPLLSEADRNLLAAWNRTEMVYPRDVPLARLLEDQVARSPQAVAVAFQDQTISYQDLNARANQLARALIAQGVGPDVLVGICVERSIDMVMGLLAVIKAGGAYVPLDPLFPRERLAHMVQDSGLKLLLSQESLRSSLPALSGTVVTVDDPSWRTNPTDNPVVAVTPTDLAYVIYTSGSTGKPKGVAVPRGALTNLLWSMRDWLKLADEDRLLGVTTLSFDIAGVDMWLPLLVGARLIVASREDAADGERLRGLIERHGITFLQATPVTWRLLLEAGWPGDRELQIVCTGEAMPRDLAVKLAPMVRKLWNLYGPTETTIWSTGYLVEKGDAPILIGRPVGNTQCHILNESLQPVPIGVVGELFIGGDGVAREYIGRTELTAEKFITDPFCEKAGARMYRTGDLARTLPDGNIECLGRTDHQVKIRGFRIELGEIESLLKQDERILEVVVVARTEPPNPPRLVGYIVPREGDVPTRAELRTRLIENLPDYMIPSEYVFLSAIPRSPNGKIDRKALPAPSSDSARDASLDPNELPATDTEKKIASIFCEVLDVKQVGRHEGFFDLGGHSLSAIRAIARINQQFEINLPVRVLFGARTSAQLASEVERRLAVPTGSPQETWPTLVPVQPKGTQIPLFCVARPNVNALGYISLARHLGPDQPVYGLQAQLPEDPNIDFSPQQYEETAREYIQAMLSVQPEGPYYVIGQCQGAYIAFEMARQMEMSGKRFGWLGILDAWTEENTRYKSLFILHLRLAEVRRRFARFWGAIRRLFRPALPPNTSEKSQTERLEEQLQGAPAPLDLTTESGFQRMLRLYFPGKAFTAPTIDSNITVFSVGHRAYYRVRDKYMGWRERTRGSIDLEPVPGGHVTMLSEPHVGVLADRIRTRIGKRRAT